MAKHFPAIHAFFHRQQDVDARVKPAPDDDALLAQSVEHRIGIAEAAGSKPAESTRH
jgi:hypothetical protein